jgi:hypothetical protein
MDIVASRICRRRMITMKKCVLSESRRKSDQKEHEAIYHAELTLRDAGIGGIGPGIAMVFRFR